MRYCIALRAAHIGKVDNYHLYFSVSPLIRGRRYNRRVRETKEPLCNGEYLFGLSEADNASPVLLPVPRARTLCLYYYVLHYTACGIARRAFTAADHLDFRRSTPPAASICRRPRPRRAAPAVIVKSGRQ